MGYSIIKRVFDCSVALILLALLAPAFVLIGIVVALFLGRPVVFAQTRPGLNGRPFKMFKFRTMTNKRDMSGKLLPDEQRMTAVGRFLRATSLDELPELINVLRGEMSLVGPRPLLVEYLELYSPEQARRHEVRPGITGWAQINGRNMITWEDKFAYDVWYVDNCSFALDLRILFLTIKQVLIREGISAEGHVTAPRFTGNNEQASKNTCSDK